MNCLNCGSMLPDDAVKCDVCGLKVPRKGAGVAVQRLKMVGIGAGIGLVIVGAFAVPAFMRSASAASAGQGSRVASDLVTHNEIVVPVQASGLDASGSRIAVHVKGLTSGGTSVEKDGYVDNEGKGLSLEQGMYEVTAVGSPISSSGVMYNLPTTGVSVEVTAEGGSSYTMSASLALTSADAASVTDEQIEAARQWILNDPERSPLADQLAEAARQRRAAAQKAADSTKNEGKQEKQEGNEAQSDQSNQSSGGSSDSSDADSDGSSSGQSDDSNYSYYGGDYNSAQSYYGGNATDANQNSGAPEQTSGGDAQPADSSQDGGGQGGQQVDPAPPDSSSGSGSGSSGTGGSSSDQGSSSAQSANGAAPTA